MNVGRYLRGEDSHVGTSRITKSKELKMNDKIREFEIECWVQREHCTAWFDSAKFAELIVRECFDCIDIMEKIANSTNASIPKDYDKHTYLKTLDSLKGLLKVHFGVE